MNFYVAMVALEMKLFESQLRVLVFCLLKIFIRRK